jgi:hypothetical protein
MHRSSRRDRIHCVLTKRYVTIETEVIDLRAIGSAGILAREEGHKACVSASLLTCPQDCIYISGGKGYGTDPTTGQRVNTM